MPTYEQIQSDLALRKELADFPDYMGSGVYSTNVAPLIIENKEDVELLDRPEEAKDGIAKAVNGMFRNLSAPNDLMCFCHRNGVSNLLYATAIPKVKNEEKDEQEAQVAMFQSKWYVPCGRTNELYVGTSVNAGRKN